MLRPLLLALVALAFSAAPTLADQPDRPLAAQLTRQGRIMVSGRALGIWSNDTANFKGGNNTWTVRADPALTYFVRDHLGVGVALSFGWTKAKLFPSGDLRTRDFALGGEFVWSAPLAARWRFFLRPFLGYGRAWGRSSGQVIDTGGGGVAVANIESSLNYVRLAVSLPFVFALSDAIGLSFGPDILLDFLFARSSKAEASSGAFQTSQLSLGDMFRSQLGASIGLYASF